MFSRFFAAELDRPRRRAAARDDATPLPRFVLVVLGLTLAGFAAGSAAGIEPVWVALAGAVVLTVPRRRGATSRPRRWCAPPSPASSSSCSAWA